MMNERGKSDTAVGAMKPANKAERSAAELVEQRAVTKGNADQQSTRRAQERESVSQALGRGLLRAGSRGSCRRTGRKPRSICCG
jgi:RNA-directed DNA polymerase